MQNKNKSSIDIIAHLSNNSVELSVEYQIQNI